jgi:hypothetical protein
MAGHYPCVVDVHAETWRRAAPCHLASIGVLPGLEGMPGVDLLMAAKAAS